MIPARTLMMLVKIGDGRIGHSFQDLCIDIGELFYINASFPNLQLAQATQALFLFWDWRIDI